MQVQALFDCPRSAVEVRGDNIGILKFLKCRVQQRVGLLTSACPVRAGLIPGL